MSFDSKSIRALALRRRLLLACSTFFWVILAAIPFGRMVSLDGWTIPRIVFFTLFLLLFSQVAFSFNVAAMGWWTLWTGRGAVRISCAVGEVPAPAELPATAIVMPIHNEEVERVFHGLKAMYQSLQKESQTGAFDFFILSDTTEPNCWIAEEKAWLNLCREVEGFGRIFYRKRRVQLHNKSGNIADFCRRWGARYRYMIVLDADSVMTGQSFVRLASLMEQHPRVGIIQTTTKPVLGQTLFQRVEQFAAAVYRPIFTAGSNYWQLGDATFWGHNAILRVKPFMRYCAMPELPEIGPLGTHILSHDTIEAALMRRGGYEVWQAYDLPGSYEESPPHLLASLQRDRRWCHGNLQHLWFLFERGLRLVSRFNIFNGIMAYANSPLWLISICLGLLIHRRAQGGGGSAVTTINPFFSLGLYLYIMCFLFAPKFFGTSLLLRSREKLKLFGPPAKVVLSVVFETIYSTLLSPILMLFYSRFVFASFLGMKVQWGRQIRSDEKGPTWRAWISVHGVNTVLVLAATVLIARRSPWLLLWLAPVLVGPILAVPFSRITASQKLGLKARTGGWFVTPEETAPPAEVRKLEDPFPAEGQPLVRVPEYAPDYGLLQAVLDPYINAIHVSLLRQRAEANTRTRVYMTILADRLLLDGPFALTAAEKRTLLWDAEAMISMHQTLWSSPAAHLHDWWQTAFRNYVESSALSIRRTGAM